MNATVESIQPESRQASAFVSSPARDFSAREGIFEVPGAVPLHHGGRLERMQIAWRLVGPANAPVVCALGGISAHRRVCATEEPRDSWWAEIAGAALPLNVNQLRILSFDYIGGSGESTGPGAGESFPSVS